MDRRAVLALCGTVAATVAGCNGNPDGGSETTRPTTDAGGTTDTTDADGTALSVRSVEVPETVELGRYYAVRIEVENGADGARRLESPISVRVGGEWRPFTALEARVQPGTTTVERDLAAPRFLGDYRFRLDDPTATWGIRTTERHLSFGTQFTTPEGLYLSVPGGTFVDSYSGTASNRTITPPEDRQFVLARIRFRNPTDESITTPPFGAFHVRAGDETYDVALDDPGQRLTLDPSQITEVELPFVVPPSVSADDVAVRWTPTYGAGRTVAVWRGE